MASNTQTKRADVQLEAAFMNYGLPECRSVTFNDDTAGDQEGEYWDLNTLDFDGTETEYYVLLDNGSTVDPVPAGKTKIPVVYTNGDSKETIAALFKTALDTAFPVTSSSGAKGTDSLTGTVTYENWYSGAVTTEDQSNASLLTFASLLVGEGGNLGATDGPFEVGFGTETVELTANQFGATKIGESFVGNSIEVSGSFLEVDAELRAQLMNSVGASVDLGGGKTFSGLGESKLFQNLDDDSKRMIIHPIRNDANNRDDDFVIWRSVFKPEGYNFDGENPRAMTGTFGGFLDTSKVTETNLCGFGDWTDTDLDA